MKVIFIAKEKFLTMMVENSLKNDGVEVFTLNQTEDSFHFIDDLNPSLVFIELQVVHDPSFIQEIHNKQIPIVGLLENDGESNEFAPVLAGTISKPLSPTNLAKKLMEYLPTMSNN